jgi:hypothetical protein
LKPRLGEQRAAMSMSEPGLDRHGWESEFQALEPELETAPIEALPELGDLVERMLSERGYDVDDPVAREGDEREVVAEFLAARETTRLVEAGADFSPGDVAAAIAGYRGIYDYLINERSTP